MTSISFRSMHNKTIIRFGYCDIHKVSVGVISRCRKPQPSALADNPYLVLDYSGYRKNLNQRESSFNMTREGMKVLRGAPKIFRHPKGGLLKN